MFVPEINLFVFGTRIITASVVTCLTDGARVSGLLQSIGRHVHSRHSRTTQLPPPATQGMSRSFKVKVILAQGHSRSLFQPFLAHCGAW